MSLDIKKIRTIVEKSIDEVTLRIMKEPSSFYTERDTHGYFYTILLKNGIPLHCIHLEYPSIELKLGDFRHTRPRYDFSIFNISRNEVWKIHIFKEDTIDPVIPDIVIELGVDTEAHHQKDDFYKIFNGKIQNGYVLNFIRWFDPSKYKNCKTFESDLENLAKLKPNINHIRFVHGPIRIRNNGSNISYRENILHWRIIDGKEGDIFKRRYCVLKEQYYSDNERVECPICFKIEF